ncbi:hypothetical protein L1887_57003 [Cichorium endivia]|nr:hypothetical protein L1887_57003 [Cichorium endivia]
MHEAGWAPTCAASTLRRSGHCRMTPTASRTPVLCHWSGRGAGEPIRLGMHGVGASELLASETWATIGLHDTAFQPTRRLLVPLNWTSFQDSYATRSDMLINNKRPSQARSWQSPRARLTHNSSKWSAAWTAWRCRAQVSGRRKKLRKCSSALEARAATRDEVGFSRLQKIVALEQQHTGSRAACLAGNPPSLAETEGKKHA